MMSLISTASSSKRGTFLILAACLLATIPLGLAMTVLMEGMVPGLEGKEMKLAILILPAGLGTALVLTRAELGFGFVVLLATALVAKTGMQIDVGPIRTSALEALIFGSASLLAFRTRLFSLPPRFIKLPIDRPLILFFVLSIPALLIAIQREVTWSNMLWELKGYFLYPLLSYAIVSWVNSESRLELVVFTGVLAGVIVAGTGILSGWQGGGFQSGGPVALDDRIGGSFGIINQYGFYLSSLALVTLGIIIGRRRRDWVSLFGIAASVVLVLGMALTGSRGAWLGLVVGLGVLLTFRRSSPIMWGLVVFTVAALWIWQLPYFGDRLLSLGDNSALTRVSYANVGLRAFQDYPLFGAGWGASFSLGSDDQLFPSDGLPWLHNEYLNLLMQTGLAGLLPFLWIWFTIIKQARARLKVLAHSNMAGTILGALAGLIALLVQAATDHVFWRPDIAGQVWWMAGILLAGILLAGHGKEA